jgi:hypothetical protein
MGEVSSDDLIDRGMRIIALSGVSGVARSDR